MHATIILLYGTLNTKYVFKGPWNFYHCKIPTGSIIKGENVGFGLDLKSNDLKVVRNLMT